ncbi:transcriptional regulator [Gluconacetobacter azotocaptans DSM 13594]|nr:transcriptional regulator [Gluconacetobacter azotocaptans DSM 13594]
MNGLVTFEAAVRCGSFALAATELNVTPPAVSRMVARLESSLKTRLLIRAPHGVIPNEAGRILFDAIARGFSGIDAAIREIEDRRDGVETVTLSLSTGFTTHWLMPRLPAFKASFPGVDLRFDLIMGALAGPVHDVDLGMRFLAASDAGHEAVAITPEVIVPVRSPSYRLDPGLTDRLAALLAARQGGGAAIKPDWSTLFLTQGGDAVGDTMIFTDYAIVIQAAILGQGVALGWLNVVARWLRTGVLRPIDGHVVRTGRMCHLVRRGDRPLRPVVGRVRDWLVGELQDDVAAVGREFPSLAP